MVDFLSVGQPLVEISLPLGVRPEHVPVVPVSIHEAVQLQNEFDEFALTLQHFIKAQRALTLLVVSLHGKVCLLVTNTLNPFNQLFVYFNLTSRL